MSPACHRTLPSLTFPRDRQRQTFRRAARWHKLLRLHSPPDLPSQENHTVHMLPGWHIDESSPHPPHNWYTQGKPSQYCNHSHASCPEGHPMRSLLSLSSIPLTACPPFPTHPSLSKAVLSHCSDSSLFSKMPPLLMIHLPTPHFFSAFPAHCLYIRSATRVRKQK